MLSIFGGLLSLCPSKRRLATCFASLLTSAEHYAENYYHGEDKLSLQSESFKDGGIIFKELNKEYDLLLRLFHFKVS